jgi:hypothetical protein
VALIKHQTSAEFKAQKFAEKSSLAKVFRAFEENKL